MKKIAAFSLVALILLSLCVSTAPHASAEITAQQQAAFGPLKENMTKYAPLVIVAGIIAFGVSVAWNSIALQGVEDSQEQASIKKRYKWALVGLIGVVVGYCIITAAISAIPS
ncbi:MAG: hypothetical protein QME47_07395 [Candidatus Thermoplasmatota archaeon]|nr:hypothetical protein [Candidatus Thermoplasmatota archaeon]